MTRSLALMVALLGSCLAMASSQAHAALDFEPGSFQVGSYDQGGQPDSRAGAHPYHYTTSFSMQLREDGFVAGYMKDIHTKLAPGIVGNPEAVPTCPRKDFVDLVQSPLVAIGCPPASQVGTGLIVHNTFGYPQETYVPVYLLEPPRGSVAQLGMPVAIVPVTLDVKLDPTENYRVEVNSLGTSQGIAAASVDVEIWGVPNDPIYDDERYCGEGGRNEPPTEPCAVEEAPVPFLANPTRCEGGPLSSIAINSWEDPLYYATATSQAPPTTGCEQIGFMPDLELQTEARAGIPTGIAVDLTIPQGDDPSTGLARGIMRTAKVTLPAGFGINASQADGLGACSDAQLGLKTNSPVACPDSSKLGTVVAETPLLANDLEGSVYLRSQVSQDPESGEMFRLAMVFRDDERGLLIKLPGQVRVNPTSGQVVTTFADNPELPVSRVRMNLKSGARAPLTVPKACGTYHASYELTAWSGQVVNGASPIAVDQNCGPRGFNPGLSAGTVNPVAGKHSPFTLRVTRSDGEQNVSRIEASLPEGLLAKLKGVALCPEQGAAAGACPAASQVGTTTVGAGAGPSPVFVPQPGREPTALYLAGPYKGAPYSLIARVPAQAGPFDLGVVAIRNALHVDPTTAQVTAVSDPLPQIVNGVPVEYRDIRVDVNRPEFMLNPTSCDPMAVAGTIGSDAGAAAKRSARFQVAGCGELGFKPNLKLSLSGQMKRSGNPALKAVLTQPANQANIDRVRVVLPKTAFIDNAHISNPCTRAQYAANSCPPKSILGKVTAYTPLLDQPLTGNVYFRANGGERELPDIVAALRGPITIDLVGFIDSVQNKKAGTARVRTTFATVPDAPVTRFVMNLKGGKVGLIENSAHLCRVRNNRASLKLDGQNGSVRNLAAPVRVKCGKSKR